MALKTNYDYRSSDYSSPYSSTPTGIRAQRPRFGYSDPLTYPRSQNTSSDIHSFSDSMVNNYGTSTSRFDTTFNSENRNSYNDNYNTSGSSYYSANDTFSHGQSYEEPPMMQSDFNLGQNGGLSRGNSMMYEGKFMHGGYSGDYSGPRAFPRSDTASFGYSDFRAHPPTAGFLSKGVSQFDASKYNATFGTNDAADFKGNFQKKTNFGDRNSKPFFAKKQNKPQRMFGIKQKSPWRCDLCDIDFTSAIPYDMHFRGAKHAKKIKTDLALKNVMKAEDAAKAVKSEDKKTFSCEICNVKANSSLQLQTHLEGSKHKAKLEALLHPKAETQKGSEEKSETQDESSTQISGKTNGSLVRPLPSDFGEPQPSKLLKYSCEVCNISVNSQIQLQQHLTSKKHQNKVEGKPITKGKKVRKNSESTTPATEEAEETVAPVETAAPVEQTSNEPSTKVVGVKTLASSFVPGETLQ